MNKSVLGLMAASMLVLSSCGGSAEEDKAAKSISASLMAEEGGTTSLKQEDADCVGEKMVDGVGLDQLTEYGVLTEDGELNKDPDEVKMSTEDAESTTDALFDCTDVQAMMDKEMSNQMAGQPAAVKKCLDEVLTDERLRGMFVATFSGRQRDAQTELMEPMMKCATKAMGG